MRQRNEGASRVVQNLAREVAAGDRKCVHSRLTVNDALTSGVALEEDTVVTFITCDGPGSGLRSTTIREEQSSREPRAPQVTRVDDVDNVRFRRHRPGTAARARMPALVPGVNVQAESGHAASSQAQCQNAKLEDQFNKPDSNLRDRLQI